jgi:diadenosine tetraphosphate (Ap4A) HIT family hydrolase
MCTINTKFDVEGTEPCFLCRSTTDSKSPWYDEVLMDADQTGIVIAAVGALTPGHVLVSPIRHVHSVRSLPVNEAIKLIPVVHHVRSVLERIYGTSTVMFEHGGCSADKPSSACVQHAHLHLLPGNCVFSLPATDSIFESLDDFLAAGQTFDAYLAFEDSGGRVHQGKDVGVSQYFRRQFKDSSAEPESWDYAADPRLETVADTIKTLRGLL